MDSVIFTLLAIIAVSPNTSVQGSTCKACNCQFNNVEVLEQLIEAKLGVTYTRWGKSSCPSSTGAQLVYSGRAGGTQWDTQGGAADKICLPDNPDYLSETSGVTAPHYSLVRGAEYEFFAGPHENLTHYNAPCAVCYVPSRATSIMVPAKTACPSGWTREYYGYLMTELGRHYRSLYTCIDRSPEVVAGSSGDENPSLFYYTIADCVTLSCPPYQNSGILACAVCTK